MWKNALEENGRIQNCEIQKIDLFTLKKKQNMANFKAKLVDFWNTTPVVDIIRYYCFYMHPLTSYPKIHIDLDMYYIHIDLDMY